MDVMKNLISVQSWEQIDWEGFGAGEVWASSASAGMFSVKKRSTWGERKGKTADALISLQHRFQLGSEHCCIASRCLLPLCCHHWGEGSLPGVCHLRRGQLRIFLYWETAEILLYTLQSSRSNYNHNNNWCLCTLKSTRASCVYRDNFWAHSVSESSFWSLWWAL